MARPRSKERRNWAPNLHQSGNGHFFYLMPNKKDGEEGRIKPMGTDFNVANEAAKILNQQLTPKNESVDVLVARALQDHQKAEPLSVAIDILESDWRTRMEQTKLSGEHADNPLSPVSFHNYTGITKRIRVDFSDKDPRYITVGMCAKFLEKSPKPQRQKVRFVFGEVFKIAVARGMCETNPVLATLEIKGVKKKRKRLTLEAFKLIRAKAVQSEMEWYAFLLDFTLQSGRRIGDVVKVPRNPFVKNERNIDCIEVRQRKGRNSKGGSNVLMEASPALIETVHNAQRYPVISDTLFCYPIYKGRNRGWKHKTGKPLPEHMVSRLFRELRDAVIKDGYKFMTLGADNAMREMVRDELPSFHEIRALTAHLARKNSGKQAAQNLLGHKDDDTTDIYLEGHEVEESWTLATALNINLAN